MMRALLVTVIALIVSVLSPKEMAAFAQSSTSGGQGGSGGAVKCDVTGVVYGTVNCFGGAGGTGGDARSDSGSTRPASPSDALQPSDRAVRVITFELSNGAAYTQEVKFFSNRHVWPSDTTAFILNTRSPVRFRLGCEPGEKICFGAYYQGSSGGWGVGRYGRAIADFW